MTQIVNEHIEGRWIVVNQIDGRYEVSCQRLGDVIKLWFFRAKDMAHVSALLGGTLSRCAVNSIMATIAGSILGE